MKAWLVTFWNSHIQFALGVFTAVTGLLEYVDAQTLNLVSGFFGPKYGPMVSKLLQCGAGLVIAYRARQVKRPASG